jgi:hypothetical protein
LGTDNPNLPCEAVSAQAALDQARYSFWQALAAGLAVAIGFLTLLAASAAALYAREAAHQTKRSADSDEGALAHQRGVSAAELRPWVSAECDLLKFTANEHLIQFDHVVTFANIGKTVAAEFSFSTTSLIVAQDAAEAAQATFDDFRNARTETSHLALLPAERFPARGSSIRNRQFIRWADGNAPRHAILLIVACASYRSPFDNETHVTERAFAVGKKGGASFVQELIIREDIIVTDASEMIVSNFITGDTT